MQGRFCHFLGLHSVLVRRDLRVRTCWRGRCFVVVAKSFISCLNLLSVCCIFDVSNVRGTASAFLLVFVLVLAALCRKCRASYTLLSRFLPFSSWSRVCEPSAHALRQCPANATSPGAISRRLRRPACPLLSAPLALTRALKTTYLRRQTSVQLVRASSRWAFAREARAVQTPPPSVSTCITTPTSCKTLHSL